MKQQIAKYDAPHQFEPLMPSEAKLGPLLEQASDLTRAAGAMGALTGVGAQVELRALLRSMNSYYTNQMEGEHTRPSEIERGLQEDYASNADLARKQRLAVAHIRTEQACEESMDVRPVDEQRPASTLYSAEVLKWLHAQLFGHLAGNDIVMPDGSALVPGQFRSRSVAIGRHEAPTPASVSAFIERWASFYGNLRRGEASIVAVAAAHHRLTWVHPFLDGNGRVARLHTHLLLHSMRLTNGLWSPLRGFARTEARYKELLQAADEHRRGPLDGRGNLSQEALVRWIGYTLDVCLDQVSFMAKQLDIEGMKDRIDAALTFEEATVKSGVRREALAALHYLFATQSEMGRAEFKAMTGLGDRTATQCVSALLRGGYVATDSAYGRLRFAVPRHALRFYFPALWPEAEQEEAVFAVKRRLEASVSSAVDRQGRSDDRTRD